MRLFLAVLVPWLLWGALDTGVYVALIAAFPENFNEMVPVGNGILVALLVLRAVYSLVAGFVSGKLAKGRVGATKVAAAVLLITGALVQAQHWEAYPFWYHVLFLGSLSPVALLGARMAGPGDELRAGATDGAA